MDTSFIIQNILGKCIHKFLCPLVQIARRVLDLTAPQHLRPQLQQALAVPIVSLGGVDHIAAFLLEQGVKPVAHAPGHHFPIAVPLHGGGL